MIEVKLDLNGLPVVFQDTAGLRESDDLVEQLGIERTRDVFQEADLRVVLHEKGYDPDPEFITDDTIVCLSKADKDEGLVGVSGKTGAGVDDLLADIAKRMVQKAAQAGSASRLRHKLLLQVAVDLLDDVEQQMDLWPAHVELSAEALRSCAQQMSELIGHVALDDVLDQVFAKFCLGK